MRLAIFAASLFLSLITLGCQVAPRDTDVYVNQGVRSLDRGTEAQIGIARANPDLDQTLVAEVADRFQTDRGATRAELASLQLKLQQQEQRLRELMASLIELSAAVAPGGETAVKVVNSIKAFIALQSADATAQHQADIDQANQQIDEHDRALAGLRSQLRTVAATTENLSRALDSLKSDTVTPAELHTSIAQLELAATKLRDQDREALRQQVIRQAKDHGLLQNAEFRATFKDELLKAAREQSLSAEDVQRIAAMTPEESLTTFGAAAGGGLVGLIALIRTLGRSRAQEEIDQLWDQLKSNELRLAEQPKPQPQT